MAAWISVILVMAAFQGMYLAGTYLLNLEGGEGPPIWALVCMTIVGNAVGGIIYCVRRERSRPPTEKMEDVALLTIAEEGLRFIIFAVVFSTLTWFNSLLGYESINFCIHPWIDRLGWPGMWASGISSFAFTARHVRKDDSMSGFMPIVPSAIFTLALVNYGPIVPVFLHLIYNAEALAWIALSRRCHRV